jgi:hypothetical protein
MSEQELKKEQFIAKAMENKRKFEIHKRLIEEHLCIGGEMYIKDLKVFAERQVVDNQLLLNLMEYAESFAKEYTESKILFETSEETKQKVSSIPLPCNMDKDISWESENYDFTIRFTEWKDNNCCKIMNSEDLFYIINNEIHDDAYTIKELLEIYKQEN